MKLDDVKKLHQKKYRNQFGHYIVEGEHLILELVKASKALPEIQESKLYVTEEYQEWANQLSSGFKILTVSKKQMVQLSDTKTPQGILAAVPLPNSSTVSRDSARHLLRANGEKSVETAQDDPSTGSAPHLLRANGEKSVETAQDDLSTEDASHLLRMSGETERCIYLHEVQDPGNLGTILRTLAWFGNFRLLLSPNSVDPYNSKVVRSSMGAIFHVPMELDVELADLENRFDSFAYLDMSGETINAPAFSNFPCYLFGNEARGVPREALDAFNATAFTIPGNGSIESLNLASAVNMSAYQLSV